MVVLQGGSGAIGSTERRASFAATVAEFDKEIKQHGARTALYMTHAYVKPHKKADPAMIRDIEKLYVEAGNKAGALVIPVGLAFEEAYKQRPDMKLHKQFDGSHPDLIGTYLAACVVYASLYNASPVGNPYDYYGKIDKDTAAFLQKVADKTVRTFYGQPLPGALSAKAGREGRGRPSLWRVQSAAAATASPSCPLILWATIPALALLASSLAAAAYSGSCGSSGRGGSHCFGVRAPPPVL